MKIYLISMLVLGLASCSSKQNSIQGFTYETEYKTQVKAYQDSVNSQLYYQTDRQQVFVPAGTIINTKKSDAN